MRRESTQRQGREAVNHRVEPGHAGGVITQKAGERQDGVDRPQPLRGFGQARGELPLLHRPRDFRLGDLPAADTQHGKDRDHQHDDAHPAQPLQFGAPDVDRCRELVEVGEYCRAGRGQSRYRLEVSIGERQPRDGEEQRHGREQCTAGPYEHDQQDALAQNQFALVAARGGPEQAPGGEVERHRYCELRGGAVFEND
ncbi:hypothetical protein D3C83_08670 [compost metagenome]